MMTPRFGTSFWRLERLLAGHALIHTSLQRGVLPTKSVEPFQRFPNLRSRSKRLSAITLGRCTSLKRGVNQKSLQRRNLDLVTGNPTIFKPHDPVAVSGINLRVRDLNDRRAFIIEALEHFHDFLALRRMKVAGRLISQ